MDTSKITAKELLGMLTARQWVAVGTVSFAVLSGVGCGGYWLGTSFTEARTSAGLGQQVGTINELRLQLSQIKTEFDQAEARASQAHQVAVEWRENSRALSLELEKQRQEVAALADQFERTSNCKFIHEQISALEAQIQRSVPSGFGISYEEAVAEDKERKALLQQRLEGYQKQLGTCNG